MALHMPTSPCRSAAHHRCQLYKATAGASTTVMGAPYMQQVVM